jgi:hypothetical protein
MPHVRLWLGVERLTGFAGQRQQGCSSGARGSMLTSLAADQRHAGVVVMTKWPTQPTNHSLLQLPGVGVFVPWELGSSIGTGSPLHSWRHLPSSVPHEWAMWALLDEEPRIWRRRQFGTVATSTAHIFRRSTSWCAKNQMNI